MPFVLAIRLDVASRRSRWRGDSCRSTRCSASRCRSRSRPLLPDTVVGLALVTSIVGALLAAVIVRSPRKAAWIALTAISLFATRVIFPPAFPAILRVGAVGLAVLFWRVSLAAVRTQRTVWFARRTQSALAVVLLLVLGLRVGLRLHDQDGKALRLSLAPGWGNAQWKIAQDLASHGIGPETRIARHRAARGFLLGPHGTSPHRRQRADESGARILGRCRRRRRTPCSRYSARQERRSRLRRSAHRDTRPTRRGLR